MHKLIDVFFCLHKSSSRRRVNPKVLQGLELDPQKHLHHPHGRMPFLVAVLQVHIKRQSRL